jgi:hypothetical protein
MRRLVFIIVALVLLAGIVAVVHRAVAKKEDPNVVKLRTALVAHNDQVALLKTKCKTLSISLVKKGVREPIVVTDAATIQKILDCIVLDLDDKRHYEQAGHLCGGHIEIRFDESWWKVIHFDHGVGIYSFGRSKLSFLFLPPEQAKTLVRILRAQGFDDSEIGIYGGSGSNK